jgi:cytoskeletal protein RodZ
MTDERDDLDRALSAGLSDLAPAEPDATATLHTLRPGLRRARTRYRIMQGSAIAAVVLALGVGVALASPGSNRAQVNVTNPPTTESNENQSRQTSTTAPGESTTAPATQTTIADAPPVSTPGAGPPPTTPRPVDRGTPSSTPENTTPATAPGAATPPAQQPTYASKGGSVTVRLANGKLTLVSYDAAAGYSPTVHTNKPDDVEVRFRKNGESDETRVRIRVVNGRLAPEIRN